MKKRCKRDQVGFTLIELMLATVLGVIVVSAGATLLAGMSRQTALFLAQEEMMGELRSLQVAFLNEARTKTRFGTTFTKDGKTSSFVLKTEGSKGYVEYTMGDGTVIDLLKNPNVIHFTMADIPSTLGLVMTIQIEELDRNGDPGEVNTYHFVATLR